jgi:hypothetical protein
MTKTNFPRKAEQIIEKKGGFQNWPFLAFFKFQTQIFLSLLFFSHRIVFFELQTYFCSIKKILTRVP